MKRLMQAAILAAGLIMAAAAPAAVYDTGEPVVRNGLSVQGIYIQEVKMTGEHAGHGHHHGHGDSNGNGMSMPGVHLEAVIRMAEEGHGFPVGAWVPYLNVHYTLTRNGRDWSSEGPLVPMLANDGPHYGANVAMPGPGKYTLTFRIAPPSEDVFPRHFDRETGIGPWLEPFEVSWEFTYVGGVGKKGGY